MSPNLTVGSFLDAYGPLFCSFVQQHQLRTSKTYSKPQNLVQNKNITVQNLENILKIPLWCFSLGFFLAQCDFFKKFFGLHQRVSPSFVSIFSNTMDVKKSQRAPFYNFRHRGTVQKSYLKYFRKFFKISQGSPFNFFFKFCNQLEFHEAQSVPFYNFEP